MFAFLDKKEQGFLDDEDMRSLFGERKETRTTMIEDLRRVVDSKNPRNPIYSKEFDKSALKVEDMLEYPHFFKQKKANLANARKLKIRSNNTSSLGAYEK